MNNLPVKIVSLFLALGILLSFGACQKKETALEETAEETQETFIPADEYGVTEYGLIPESAFPNHSDLREWYAKSKERNSLIYAVFYAKDAASNVWYCWMYAEGYTCEDSTVLSVDESDGTHVRIDLTLQNADAVTPGAVCFAFPSDTEPTFSLTVGGNPEGLIVTLSQKVAIPVIS